MSDTELTDAEFAALVERAQDLRKQCEGRLPHNVSWKFTEFVLGTVGFTWPERGVYLGLLWRQFDKGHVPDNVTKLAAMSDMEPAAFQVLWDGKLADKFRAHADGHLYNVTMLREWIAQAEYLLSARERGRKGGRKSAAVRSQADTGQPF